MDSIDLPKDAPEKQNIEYHRALHFLNFYNHKYNSSFRIKRLADSPDVICEDENGNRINLEITLAEDRRNDIKAMLGKSDHKSAALKRRLPVATEPLRPINRIYEAIYRKIYNRYGPNTALIICYASPLKSQYEENDWNDIKRHKFSLSNVAYDPFDKGIWIVSLRGGIVFRILYCLQQVC